MIHETEEQNQSKILGTKDYDIVHPKANEMELQITGKQESPLRDDSKVISRFGKAWNIVAQQGYTQRFDYIDRNGNYIETRETRVWQGGRFLEPRTLNNNTPTEKINEKRFRTSTTGSPIQYVN